MADPGTLSAGTLFPGWMLLAWLLDAACLALAVFWAVALFRLVRTALMVPTARAGLRLPPPAGPAPPVCAVIPAHNEEATIGGLVASLRAQDYPALRVVLCLDRCTDGTLAAVRRAIGGDGRFEVVEVAACPEGWAGKVNAVAAGTATAAARGADLLLFADADTQLDPACIRACVALLRERRLDLLSLLSTLTCGRWFERLVQPAAGFELVREYPIVRANRRQSPRAFANGQFMLIRREAFEGAGGHEAVHDELLEDLALARRLADAGRPIGVFLAAGLLRCRMYETWPAFRAGWKRIFVEASHRKLGRLRRNGFYATFSGAVLPALTLLNVPWSLLLLGAGGEAASAGEMGLWLAGAGLVAWAAGNLAAYRMAGVPLWVLPGAPVGSWLLGRIMAEAATDLRDGVPIRWAAREYVRERR
ncbi:MAG: glycosyltransferase [Phycisphaerales bacterium]